MEEDGREPDDSDPESKDENGTGNPEQGRMGK